MEDQQRRGDSVLNYYKKLLKLRKSDRVFTYGDITPKFEENEDVLAYIRSNEEKTVLVAANFGKSPVTLLAAVKTVLMENIPAQVAADSITLSACGVIVAEL